MRCERLSHVPTPSRTMPRTHSHPAISPPSPPSSAAAARSGTPEAQAGGEGAERGGGAAAQTGAQESREGRRRESRRAARCLSAARAHAQISRAAVAPPASPAVREHPVEQSPPATLPAPPPPLPPPCSAAGLPPCVGAEKTVTGVGQHSVVAADAVPTVLLRAGTCAKSAAAASSSSCSLRVCQCCCSVRLPIFVRQGGYCVF